MLKTYTNVIFDTTNLFSNKKPDGLTIKLFKNFNITPNTYKKVHFTLSAKKYKLKN